MTWNPIETAPKDEWVLVWSAGEKIMNIAKQDGFGWMAKGGRDLIGPYDEPTHWHPLPQPPEGE